MPDYPEIYVLRHGQTEWNLEGRYQGRKDSPLTDKGRGQAQEQGRLLQAAQIDWNETDAFCSPQMRALTTAQIALDDLDVTIRQDARLCEISFGHWEGRTFAEIEAESPELDHDGDPFLWHFFAPGGESYEDMAARVQSFLDDLKRPAVIVTHGITSRVLRGLWLGVGLDGMRDMPGGQGNVHHLANGAYTQLVR
jgi:probable phosphoglycerate mutase